MDSERIAILNDLHIPWHDPRLVNLVLDILQDPIHKISKIILNGDVLDFYNCNSHGPKHPAIKDVLEDELSAGLDFIKELRRRFPKIPILFIYGNHEWRLERFIVDKCPAFWNILKLEKQLQLEHYNIEMLQYNKAHNIPGTDLFIQHSPPSYSENAASTALKKKPGASYIWGCTHRIQRFVKKGKYRYYEAYLNGWLGSTNLSEDHFEVFRYTKGHDDWQNGFSIVDVVGDWFSVNQYLIKDYKASVGGYLYEAR